MSNMYSGNKIIISKQKMSNRCIHVSSDNRMCKNNKYGPDFCINHHPICIEPDCKNKSCCKKLLKFCSNHSRDCSICYETTSRYNIHTFSCGHIFHVNCIIPWISTGATTCPNCRSNFMVEVN